MINVLSLQIQGRRDYELVKDLVSRIVQHYEYSPKTEQETSKTDPEKHLKREHP